MVPDEVLVQMFVDGAAEPFEELIRRYQGRMVNFIYRSTGDYQRAEELAQEAFMRVFRNGRNYDERYRFSTWIYTIAKNLAANELRDRSRNPDSFHIREADWPTDGTFVAELVSSQEREPHRILTDREMQQKLAEAIARLEPDQRMALVMKEYEGMTYSQIADVFGASPGTVKSWLHRSKRQLAKWLKESEVL
jgi:RNA polymerase sigma-70 factor (ECF subfamily)